MSQPPDPAAGARLARLEDYLAVDPDNPRLLFELIDVQRQCGQLERALALAERAAGLQAQEPGLRRLQAQVLMDAGRPHEARGLLLDLHGSAPEEMVLVFELAYAEFLCGQYQCALDRLAALPADQLPECMLLQARCLHHLSDPDAALGQVSAFLAVRPHDASALGLAALLAFDAIRLTKARRWAAQALQADRDNFDALVAAAGLAFEDRDFALARDLNRRVLALDSANGRAWLGWAMVDMHERNLGSAMEHLNKAVACMPRHLGSKIALAWCHLAVHDLDGAREQFERALAQDRNFSECHGGLAMLCYLQGEQQLAASHAERALGLDRNCISALHVKALLDGTVHDARTLDVFSSLTLARVPGMAERRADQLRELP